MMVSIVTRVPSAILLATQSLTALAGLVTLAGLPPERGRILMVPLDGTSAATMARLATTAGGSLVDTGRWPDFLIAEADLAALRAQTHGHRILLLRAPDAGCNGQPGAGA